MPETTFRGRVWKLGDDIDTDIIIGKKYLLLPLDQMKNHAMEAVDPQFGNKVKPGDIIVAGQAFGCGSSREQAAAVLKALGISVILAESFARIFFRNAITIALPVLECKNVSKLVREGDEVEVDFRTGQMKDLTTGQSMEGKPLSKQMLDIIESGGAIKFLIKKKSREKI